MPDSLVVRLHDLVVGRLTRGTDPSRVRLDVDAGFDPGQITLTESFTAVPGGEPPSDTVSNFLGGYVPEGHHRLVMASRRGIDAGDLFALLREFGGSLAGALTARPPDNPDDAPSLGWLEHLSEAVLGDRLRQALRDTDQAVPDDSRSTLPGFQPKVLAHRVAGGWAQPRGSAHSTYILEADGVTFLAIQRFDRQVLPDGAVGLIHQEDAAQALGLDWRTADAKFQDPHWPGNPSRASAQRVAQLLASGPGGSTLVREWVRRLVLSIFLSDNDAHAKNIALLHSAHGTALAPAYDIVPGLFARDVIDEGFRMAFAVNGTFDHRQMSVDALVAEVQSWRVTSPGLASSAVEEAIAGCARAIRNVAPPAGISAGLVDKLTWAVDRLTTGEMMGTSPWQDGKSRKAARRQSPPRSGHAGRSRT